MKQAKLIGVLYLENNLASHVFTSARISLLKLLSSQAAISLENARLYAERQKAEHELRDSEQRFRDYAETASDWLWETGPDHRFTWVSERATLGMGSCLSGWRDSMGDRNRCRRGAREVAPSYGHG